MSKLLISLLFVVAFVACASGEQHLRWTVYQNQGCQGPEAWSAFIPTKCTEFNSTYRYYSCEKDVIYRYHCGSDKDCSSCKVISNYTSECNYISQYSCTDKDFTDIYGPDSPIEFYYKQQDCKGDLYGTIVYNTSAKYTQWASCSNDQFYLQNATYLCDDCATKKPMECTYDPKSMLATERFCGWPGASSDAFVLYLGFYIISFVTLLV